MNWWIDSDVVELGFETATRKRCNGKETDIPKHLTILTTLFGGLSSNKDIWQSLHLYQTTSISCQPYTAADDAVNRIAGSPDLQSGYSDVPHFLLRFIIAFWGSSMGFLPHISLSTCSPIDLSWSQKKRGGEKWDGFFVINITLPCRGKDAWPSMPCRLEETRD